MRGISSAGSTFRLPARGQLALACVLVLCATAAPASASVLFSGDFETGDTSQWSREQQGRDPNDDITVQSEIRIQGAFAGMFTVEPGDHFPASQTGGDRAEVVNSAILLQEGDVRWFGWSVFFASGFPTSDDSGAWNIFTQWHHNGSNCSVPLEFAIRDNGPDNLRRMVLTSRTGTVSSTTCSLTGREFDLGLLRTGEWMRFEVQVGFSADPSVGFVEVYVNDQLALPRTQMATLYTCCRSYTKQGYYRKANAENTATLYLDGTTFGTTRADVEQPEPLSVETSGPGAVSSSPAGIACGTTCAWWFSHGTEVTMTAAADAHATFTGWSGACASESTDTCTLTMNAAKDLAAIFALERHELEVEASGPGSVSSSPTGIICPGACTGEYPYGTEVTLTAASDAHATFTGWSGPCAGNGTTCTLTMDAAKNVTATFALVRHVLEVEASGPGSVSSSPTGITCPGACEAEFTYGTGVTLTAAPAAEAVFTGWSGACASESTATCAVTMDAAKDVTATFGLAPPLVRPPISVAPPLPPGCTLAGTAEGDILVGTSGNDVICGLGGNDTIKGLGDNDRLIGGGGNDTLIGQAGADTLRGGAGKDLLLGGRGNDFLVAKDGERDTASGGLGIDRARVDRGLDRRLSIEKLL